MTLPFDITKIYFQLLKALQFINNYTRDTFPLFFSTKYLAPNAFHDVEGRQNYFPSTCGTSEALTILGVAFFKAWEATGNQGYLTLALHCAESYRNYFHLDDLFNTQLNGLDTPLVRNHWLSVVRLNKDSTPQKSEGFTDSSLVSDPFNFGYFETANFTNGLALLNSDLSKVFRVYSGELEYRNVFSPLKNGTNYLIEYWIAGGKKRFTDGTFTNTNEPNGRVKLSQNISGNFQIIYSRLNGFDILPPSTPLQGEHFLEPYPIWYKCKQANLTYTGAAFDAYWWSYEMYELAYKHSNLNKYNNAKEVIKWNTIKYSNLQDTTYFYQKSTSSEPLSTPASYLLQYAVNANGEAQTKPGYTASRELIGNKKDFLKLQINTNNNLNIFSGVELQNYVAQVFFDPLVTIYLEAAISITEVLEVKVSLSPNANDFSLDYYAYWLLQGYSQPRSRRFSYLDFLRFTFDNVWHPRIAESPVFTFNFSVWSYEESLINSVSRLVIKIENPNLTSGFGLVNAKFTNKLPNIVYKISGLGRFRFKDSSNNFYYLDVSDTGGAWLTFSGSWSSTFNVSDRLCTELVFENAQVNSTVWLYVVGEEGEILPVPSTSYKAAVVTKGRQAHILWVGDFKPENNSLEKLAYTPGSIPFTINTLNGFLQGFRGKQWYLAYQSAYSLAKWGYKNYAKNVVKLISDGQDSYALQSNTNLKGLLHQVFLPYDVENIPYLDKLKIFQNVLSFPIPFIFDFPQEVATEAYKFNEFSWKGLDPNTRWGAYCFRAYEDLSRYYLENQGDIKARKVLETYINFAYTYYTDNPTLQITDIVPKTEPEANYPEPHMAAIEGLTFIYANLAGIQLTKTWELIQNRFNYIDSKFVNTGTMSGSWSLGQPEFTHNGQTYKEWFTFWQGKIIEFYSVCLLKKDFITKGSISNLPIYPPLVNPRCSSPAHFIEDITDLDFPVVIQQYSDATEQRLLLNKQVTNKEIILRYEKLDSSKTKELIDFYNECSKNFDGYFIFNTQALNNAEFSGTWVFKEKPSIETYLSNSKRGVFNIQVSIRQVKIF